MLEELDKLITLLQSYYDELDEKWKNSNYYLKINQKKKLVKDIKTDNNIFDLILNYRMFINENSLELKIALNNLKLDSVINNRVKAQNSIEYKLKNYMSEKHGFGEVPINKCFNDLYGIRIIFQNNITFREINEYIKKRYNIKCYDASKDDGYIATHIYLKNDNYSFQWELQIWDKEHEQNNILSHERYKQDYTKWEKDNKGGGLLC